MVPPTSDPGASQNFAQWSQIKESLTPKSPFVLIYFLLKVEPLEGINIQMNKNSTCPGKKGHELGLSCHLKLYHSVSYKILKGCPEPGPKPCQPPRSTADPTSTTQQSIRLQVSKVLQELVPSRTAADSQKPPPHPTSSHYAKGKALPMVTTKHGGGRWGVREPLSEIYQPNKYK